MTTDQGEGRSRRGTGWARRLGKVKVRNFRALQTAISAGVPAGPRSRGPLMWAALFCAATTACASTGGGNSKETSEGVEQAMYEAEQLPLGADALRALLRDVYVTAVLPPGNFVSHAPGEVFKSDGVYVRIPNRNRQYGVFAIEGNQVCVEGADFPKLCRQIVAQRDGTYALVDLARDSKILVTIEALK